MISVVKFLTEDSSANINVKSGRIAFNYLPEDGDSVLVFDSKPRFVELYITGDISKFKIGQKEEVHIESERGVDFNTFVKHNKLKVGKYKGSGEFPDNFTFSCDILKGKYKIYTEKSGGWFSKGKLMLEKVK